MKTTPLLALAALLLAGCQKDDPEVQLPAATQTGANTAGCLIDGQPFVATGWGGGLFSNGVPALGGGFYGDSAYYLRINGQLSGQNATVTVYLNARKSGNYQLNKDTQYYPVALRVSDQGTFSADAQSDAYVTNARNTGQVMLASADIRTGISSGTFEFTAASQRDPDKTVTITSGRFDRKQ